MPAIALFGSGEFMPWARDVDTWCADQATTSSDRVLVVPTASALEGDDTFHRWGEMGVAHYRDLGLAPEVLPLRSRKDASDPAIVDRVSGARLIFFSGGNPGYLAETVMDTPFWDALCHAVADGTALGGCSAGAVFLGVMAPYVEDDAVKRWVDGTRLLADAYIAPHFDALESYMTGLRRLFLSQCPDGCIAVGIDEDTALYGDGASWSVTGRGGAWFGTAGDPFDLREHRAGARVEAPLGLALP